MDYGVWLNKAIKHIPTINIGDVFVVKDLFNGTEWKALPTGDKLSFGRYFKNAVINNTVQDVIYIGKADNNSALYQKV